MTSAYTDLVISGARLGVPLLFAVWGALISYRAGVFNVALEGFILAGALSHVLTWETLKYQARFTDAGALLGATVFAVVVGALLGGCFGAFIRKGLEPITAGIALNMAVFGLIRTLEKIVLDPMVQSRGSALDFNAIRNAGMSNAVENLTVWALAGTAILAAVYSYTPFGKQATAAGRPQGGAEALQQAGGVVSGAQFRSSVITGVICAFAGVSLVWLTGTYTSDMSAGRGYVALALALVGSRSILFACTVAMLYGFAQSPQLLAIMNIQIAPQVVASIPYLLTLLVLAGFGLYTRITRSRLVVGVGHD